MKAVVYDGPRQFSVREIPTPVPGPGQIRIKVGQTGVCGTDLHIHEGGFQAEFPLTPGHEVVGWVDALGEGVSGLGVGEQVTVNPNLACGHCDPCRSERPILCANHKGFGANAPGFFAEYALAPARLVHSVEGIDPDVAVFTEPASCACHGIDVLELRAGSTVLVVGAGPTGLLLAQLLGVNGASHVTVAATKQFKLDVAGRLGIDRTVLIPRGDVADAGAVLRAASPSGDGYDYVIEATGAAEIGTMCLSLVRDGGTVLIYGVMGETDRVSFSPFDVFRREITIKGSFAEILSFNTAIGYLRSGKLRTEGIVSHRFSLDDYGKAIATLAGDPTAHKVVIQVS